MLLISKAVHTAVTGSECKTDSVCVSMCLYLGAIERDHSVQTIELDEQSVRVPLHMRMVLWQQLQQQLHLILKTAGTRFQMHRHWAHSCIASYQILELSLHKGDCVSAWHLSV